MGLERHPRCAPQQRVEAGIDGVEQLADATRAFLHLGNDLPVAFLPVREEGMRIGRPVGDRSAVRRQVALVGEAEDLFERGEIVRHRAVRHGDEGRVPAHDVVAGQQPRRAREAESEVVGAVAGRGDDLETDIAGHDSLPVLEHPVRPVPPVALAPDRIDFEQPSRPAEAVRATRPDRRAAGGGNQARYERRVIEVGVGNNDRIDQPAVDRGHQSRKMRLAVRAGIEDGDAVGAEDKTVGAAERVGAGIGRGDADNAGGDGNRLARPGIEVCVELQGRRPCGHIALSRGSDYQRALENLPLLKDWQWP